MTTDLARWQFATTSIYHFLFVPVTIGLAFLVALLQTSWYRNDNPTFKRLTKFFGTLLLINVAVGVVTGLVQEFEFGMNWSNYSRFVGNIFGGPLAMEGLVAFFLESTFLGIWIFGWDRLSKKLHLTCIWLVAGASMLSALFIMAANSWMQHPVGYVMNAQHQPQLTDIWALFTNPVFLWAYPHVILASLVTGAIIMLAFSAWHLQAQELRRRLPPYRHHLAGRAGPGHLRQHVHRQRAGCGRGQVPADEDRRRRGAVDHLSLPLPVLAVPDRRWQQRRDPHPDLEIPDLLSILATNHPDGEVQGMNNLQAQYVKEYGPGNYIPNVFIQYWGMRVMAYLAALIALFALWGLWLIRRKTLDKAKWFLLIAPWFAIAPFLMNTAGWLLTESGRQPWIVQGLMKTSQAASPSVTATDIWISLTVFVLLYLSLGVADVYLMIHYGRQELEPSQEESAATAAAGPDRCGGGLGGRVRRRPGPGPHLLGGDNGPSQQHLVRDHRHLLGGVLHSRGVRLRRRDAALVRREERRRASHRRQLDRADLGRERGMAGRGGSGDLRGVPVVVRHDVLHLLPGHGDRPSGPDRARGLLRVPPQDRRPAVAVGLAVVAHHRERAHPASCSAPLWATSCTGCRSTPPTTTPAASSGLLVPLRALHRSHLDRALPVPRCRLPHAQDRGRAARSGRSAVGPARLAGRGDHLRLADLEPCRDSARASFPSPSTRWRSSR